ncbi:MAG: o-succinylbenzoate synthase [Bacteroidia bacterium]
MLAEYKKHVLEFKTPSRTSRGEMRTHTVYYIYLRNEKRSAIGEAAPLKGLSVDDVEDFEERLKYFCELVNSGIHPFELDLKKFPSIRFAFESCLEELKNNEPHALFPSHFLNMEGIPINGLVWMDTKDKMQEQAFEKIKQGFNCLKFKIGALDFDEECRMIETVRKKYSAFNLEIRLDANGAFTKEDVFEKLKELSRFEIHSIEQPVKPKQYELMQEVCSVSKIKIALDEELIGWDVFEEGEKMLKIIRPAYLILKPTLLGGFSLSNEWIRLTRKYELNWWITSALESNIGLNAIAQWAASLKCTIPQGLGTGSLYKNNIASSLKVSGGKLYYDKNLKWGVLKD